MVDHQQLTFGIDLGGTSTRVGLYDASMQLIDCRSMITRVSAGPQSCVEEIAEGIDSMNREYSAGGAPIEVLGIGIGSPGPINLRTGVLGLLPNLPGWNNFPLRDALATVTKMPVLLESDANAAAIAEWKLGAGQSTNLDSMAMITLGTGVGSGLIFGGRVWHGMFGMGGEVGHATVVPEGLLCGCGSRGCLEMYASANGLLRLAAAAADSNDATPELKALVTRSQGFTSLDVAELAWNDPSAQRVFHCLGHFLGIGIANLINILDLPLIVVGGGMACSWNLFAPAMFRAVRDYSLVYRLATPTQVDVREQDRTFICPAVLGPSAGLLGAALLPRLAVLNVQSVNASLIPEII
ncbi:ROK family protein [Tunturiibacter lichenicola]|jgi:glucokinase|uniref:ROK family protein n=1 Tax=Tunturiibacter lichenicola TaxID=2051959 RepID=UPI003D9AF7BC